MMSRADVSIVIVNWNTRDILRDCLNSIYRETEGLHFEVIVIDNASADGSAAMVREEFPQVVLIENPENKGFAAANNQGLTLAKGRYVLLLNSDTIILDNAIAKTMFFADFHPEAAVFGCRILNPDHTLQRTCFMFPSILNMILSAIYLYKLFPKSRFFGRERMTWWNGDDVRAVDVVTGCFMLVTRKAIEQIGYLDERFFIYGEETDWCYRFSRKGWKTLFTPEAEIIHLGGQSSKKLVSEMSLQLRGGILQFMRKHYSGAEYKLACVLTWFFFAARVPFWFFRQFVNKPQRQYCRLRLNICLEGMRRLVADGGEGLCLKITKRGIPA